MDALEKVIPSICVVVEVQQALGLDPSKPRPLPVLLGTATRLSAEPLGQLSSGRPSVELEHTLAVLALRARPTWVDEVLHIRKLRSSCGGAGGTLVCLLHVARAVGRGEGKRRYSYNSMALSEKFSWFSGFVML